MDTILTVSGLTKHYPGFTLDHVSFSVPGGSIMGLIGENGAGKSTTIKALLGLVRPDEGSAAFWGQDLAAAPRLKEDLGVVFDGGSFYETLTPAQVGSILRHAYSQWDDGLYRSYLERFAVRAKRRSRGCPRG